MEKISSADGTRIAYHASGAGRPLVLVQGTGASNPTNWPAFPLLAEQFRVYAVDRRGRGESGDGPTYDVKREFEDIAAVVDAIGGPVHLLGHSFGALLALEAMLLSDNVRRLVLYEPALALPGVEVHPAGLIDEMEALLGAGDREGMLVRQYREVGLKPDEIEQMRSSPAWGERLEAAATVPREMRAVDAYRFEPERFQELQTPALLLLGADSPPIFREMTEPIDAALPASRIAVMPGQEHIAMYAAPELFAKEVASFLLG